MSGREREEERKRPCEAEVVVEFRGQSRRVGANGTLRRKAPLFFVVADSSYTTSKVRQAKSYLSLCCSITPFTPPPLSQGRLFSGGRIKCVDYGKRGGD